MRILVVGPIAVSLLAFRGELLRSLVSRGHEVLALAPSEDAGVREGLRAIGVQFMTVPMHRNGTNPIRDLGTLRALVRVFRWFDPDIVLCYAVKPVIYGSLAARLTGVPRRTAMITGLGSALVSRASSRAIAVSRLMRLLYAVALRGSDVIFFQNPDDQRLFRQAGLIGRGTRVVRINGSGVDLQHYAPTSLPAGEVTFVMIGRLIRDKGVAEYVEAARMVREAGAACRFLLVGGVDSNPTSVTPQEVEAWQRAGIVEYLGTTDDVRPAMQRAHVVVLPSYGEGMPRAVLEGMSMGRAILTTDVAGCRETVVSGRNGHLVPPRDAEALAAAMLQIASEPARLAEMGLESRRLAEQRFDVHAVNRAIIDALGA